MGRSEWAVLCRSRAEARRILEAVIAHNEYDGEDAYEVGEQLECGCLLRFHGLPFLCLTNGGGRTSTNKWLWDRLSDLPTFWALSKPPGWFECQDYLWEAGSTEGGRPENIDVSALPLPDTAPPGPLPVVPELGDWLTPQKPVTDVGAAYFGVHGATGFMVSFDPQTGERTEKLIMRGDKPFEGWPF